MGFTDLLTVRIGGTAEHLFKPESMIYVVSMDGPLYEADVNTLEVRKIIDLVDALAIPVSPDPHTTGQCYPHFKAALTVHTTTDGKGGLGDGARGGHLYVASNGYNEADYLNGSSCGRFASWDGVGDWQVLEHTAFYEVVARKNYGRAVYAAGWDSKSAILKVLDVGAPDAPVVGRAGWQTLRLPKASHAFDHGWQTEWPRIREVETERYLLDHMGLFYELSPLGWGSGSTFGVRPISQHLRVVPDFASFRGLLVMGGNEVSSIFDNNIITGQAQSGLWLGKTDDLWSWGKPQGWGSVWQDDNITVNAASDPFLMTGFDKKVLHLSSGNADRSLVFTIEIDPLGDAMRTGKWRALAQVTLESPAWYASYVFPAGFSAHWVRVRGDPKTEAPEVT